MLIGHGRSLYPDLTRHPARSGGGGRGGRNPLLCQETGKGVRRRKNRRPSTRKTPNPLITSRFRSFRTDGQDLADGNTRSDGWVHKTLSGGAQGLVDGSVRSCQGVHKDLPIAPQDLANGCTRASRRVHKILPMDAQGLPDGCPLSRLGTHKHWCGGGQRRGKAPARPEEGHDNFGSRNHFPLPGAETNTTLEHTIT